MIIPVKYAIKVLGDDSFLLEATWKDEDGNVRDLTGRTASMPFFVSKTDRTVVKTLTTTPSVGGSVVTFSDEAPNISALIVRGETGIGTTPDFTDEPGYYLLRVIISATLDDRLLEGLVHYVV